MSTITEVFMICDAYEGGMGQGLHRSRAINPYDPLSKLHEAYQIGYELGLQRSEPPTASKAGAVNACQHKNRSGEVAQGRTMYEVCMDCGKRLDLITEGDAQP